MTDLVKSAQDLKELRLHILKNEHEGKPIHDGLDMEQVKRSIDYLRGDRRAAATAKKTSASKPVKNIDLLAFVTGGKKDEPKK